MKFVFSLVFIFSFLLTNAQTTVEPYPDNSWDIATYEYLGIPAIDKPWTEKELRSFMKVMEKVYQGDKWSLPRKDSPYSGKLFDKMLSKELFEPISDPSLSMEDRINYLNKELEYSNFIASIYKEDNRPTERFGREVLTSFNFLVYSAKEARLFLDELKLTLPKNAVEQPQFKKMYNQSTEQIVSLLKLLIVTFEKEVNRYDNNTLSDFSGEAVQTVEKCWKLLSGNQQDELIKELEKLKKHPIKEVRQQFKELMKQMKM